MALVLFLVALGLSGLTTSTADYKGKEAWGYVQVRKGAFMFWWLYYTDVSNDYNSYPLVIWLQGGPGASGTGYGNFLEIGPLDLHLKPRNTTWVKKANLLFLDNPVGTGFSYVTDNSSLAKNNSQIASDLLVTLQSLLQNIPEFQKSPLYIFGESYGGKMAVDFAIALNEEITKGKIVCNFKGIALGDSWISPFDSVASWGQYLHTMSLITGKELSMLSTQVNTLKKTLALHKYADATEQFGEIQALIGNLTDNVDFYNIMKSSSDVGANQTINKLPRNSTAYNLFRRNVGRFYDDPLSNLMNGPIKEKLHVIPKNITWGGQSSLVFSALTEDFMKPVVDSVDFLLNRTKLDVNVYSGQLDLIVDSLGTISWVQNLKWPGVQQFMNSEKRHHSNNKGPWGFSAEFKNFHFYWILRAGHMVPSDAGEAAVQMLDSILTKKS